MGSPKPLPGSRHFLKAQ